VSSATISLFLRRMLLANLFTANSFPPLEAVYFALTRAVPVANATGATLDEPTGGSYARAPYLVDGEHWTMTEYAQAYNSQDVIFSQATDAWGYCQGYAVCTESTGGETLFVGRLTTPATIAAGMIPAIGAGNVYVELVD